MKIENSLSASELMGIFTSRKDQYSNAISELEDQLTQIRIAAVKEKDLPLVFAGVVLSSACKSDKEEAKNFACALISHIKDGKPTSSFLECNPDYIGLDLTWFVEENPGFKKILAPIKKQNFFGLLNGTGLIEELGNKEYRGSERSPKKDAVVNIDSQPSLTTIEDVKSLYPNIRRLFDEESDAWVFVNGIRSISSKTLFSLFEKTNPSGNKKKDNLAIRQSFLGEWGQLYKFIKESSKHSRNEVTKLRGNMLYFSKELVTDFLVFVADKLSSRNTIEIKIKDGEDIQLFNSKKSLVETQIEIIPPLPVENISKIEQDPEPGDPPVVKIDPESFLKPDPVTPEISKDRRIIGWRHEDLMTFFASREGNDISKKVRDKSQISPNYYYLTKNYPAIDTLLDSKKISSYWKPEHKAKGGTLRTSSDHITKLLRLESGLGRYLTTEEQNNFLENNLNPLWGYLFFTNIGGKVDGEEGIFLTKEEYINAVLLLEVVLKQKELNPMGIVLSRDVLSDVVSPKLRRES
jgi:hypothetical protein